jgi:hypothetical protein
MVTPRKLHDNKGKEKEVLVPAKTAFGTKKVITEAQISSILRSNLDAEIDRVMATPEPPGLREIVKSAYKRWKDEGKPKL